MADKEKHSPLPWIVWPIPPENKIAMISDVERVVIVPSLAEVSVTQAELIVHCVNTHDKLVEALEAVIGFQKAMERKSVNPDDVGDYHEAVIRQVEAALAEETK